MTVSSLQNRVLETFSQQFGGEPELAVHAPGRVNLIGEHTDYNGGFALPCALRFGTFIAARKRPDRTVRVVALDFGDSIDEFSLDTPFVQSIDKSWANYIRGVAYALMESGRSVGGVDLAIAGDVPRGAGLSSSASITVAVGQTFREMFGLSDMTPTDIALIAQRSENDYVGVKCGNLDQLASACGRKGHALLIDCRSLETHPVPMPDGLSILIVESGVTRGLVESAYNKRREECAAAARFFGVAALRDVDLPMLEGKGHRLGETVFRRARHIVSENQRTIDMAAALKSSDLSMVGPLMAQSHASMRDDFEITVPKVDDLVDILQEAIGTVGGARMTGGGFGGCVVGLMPSARVEHAQQVLQARYETPDGRDLAMYVCSAEAGAGVVTGWRLHDR